MPERYVLIDEAGGWLVDLVIWDGDTEKWSPPPGQTAIKASEIDFASLPHSPHIVITTAHAE